MGDRKGNPAGVDPDNACGKKIAVQKDTVQVDDIQARSKACTDAGKPAITIDQFQGQDAATAAVVSGKDDAMLADYRSARTRSRSPTASSSCSARSTTPRRTATWSPRTSWPSPRRSRDAIKALIADGTYTRCWRSGRSPTAAITDAADQPVR